jgi:phage baseplate assembly protein gpV
MEDIVTYGHVEVMPYEFVHLKEIKIIKKANDHARMFCTGIISEEYRDRYVNASDEQTQVKAFVTDGNGNRHPLFRGIALDVEERVVQGVHYLTFEAVSHTYLLDIKRHRRSFQNPKLTYTGLIESIISDYAKADAMDVVSSGKAIGTFIMQYDETDWQFLKRMASHFYSPLIPAVGYGVPKFYFGIPMGLSKGEITSLNYKVTKRVADYQTASENRIPGVKDSDFIQYEMETEKLLEPGYEVTFKGKLMIVAEVLTEMRDGVLVHSCKLTPRSGLRPIKDYNRSIIGASIQGKVISIHRDKIRAKLDMDDQQDPNTDYWFPYSTIYASADNTGWYCMPEEGDNIRIYFPSYKEEDGYAISSIKRDTSFAASPSPAVSSRSGGNSSAGSAASSAAAPAPANDRMADPAIKTLRTKYGKEIMLAPDKIVISASDMSITISDSSGIDIVSGKNVNLSAASDIVLSSGNIHLSANKIQLSGKGNSVTLEDNISLSGTEIKLN